MDLKPFRLDIDELIHDFSESGSTSFTEFKRFWLSRKFSFIFEASPSSNQGCFMQSLYAHCIGHMVSTSSLSNRLGGFYCLYCLFETQPFKPSFKIYLYLGELRSLKHLVADAKQLDLKVVSALVKMMLDKNMFLFGYAGVSEVSVTHRINELTDIQNAHVQAAYTKLFPDSRLERFIHMDLSTEFDVDLIKQKSSEYAVAKELAISEASQVINVQDISHIVENKKLIGDTVEKTATDWILQKDLYYEQTGFIHSASEHPQNEENELEEPRCSDDNMRRRELSENLQTLQGHENQEEFSKELEEVLLSQPLEFDNENVGHVDNWDNT